jgi:hypothetical protein
VEQLASDLERLNPNKNALSSPLINAKWRLLYTTSASILGTNKPPFLRPAGPIYQTIDAVNLRAKNEETWPFFNQVQFTPERAHSMKVRILQQQCRCCREPSSSSPASTLPYGSTEIFSGITDEMLHDIVTSIWCHYAIWDVPCICRCKPS